MTFLDYSKAWIDIPLVCGFCNNLKPSICFYKDPIKSDDQRECKDCASKRSLEYRLRTGLTKGKRRPFDREKLRLRRRFNRAKRRAALLKRIPKWLTKADWVKIKLIYAKAQYLSKSTGTKHHVDHVYPLRGKIVSGLHVPSNLRILTERDNLSKGNKV